MKRFCVLYNPTCENGEGEDLFNQIRPIFNELPTKPILVEKTSTNINLSLEKIVKVNPDFIFVCGGDGTVNQLVNELIQIPIALVPLGNGNDFSRTINSTRCYETLISNLYHGKVKKINVGLVEFKDKKKYFVNEASIGISSTVIDHVKNSILPKSLAFGVYGAYYQLDGTYFKIDYQGKSEQIKLLVISNGKYFGNGMNIQPNADPTDGVFDCCVLKSPSFLEVFSVLKSIYTGAKKESENVKYFTTSHLSVTGDSTVELDGEICGSLPCSISVSEKHINMICED